MVAYSFKRRFVPAIQLGLGLFNKIAHPIICERMTPKRQTIRADRRRHARPGEELQLYVGITKQCELIGRALCTDVAQISIHFRDRRRSDWLLSGALGKIDRPYDLDKFAKADGFEDWAELREFWATEHPNIRDFHGVMVSWAPLEIANR